MDTTSVRGERRLRLRQSTLCGAREPRETVRCPFFRGTGGIGALGNGASQILTDCRPRRDHDEGSRPCQMLSIAERFAKYAADGIGARSELDACKLTSCDDLACDDHARCP